MEIDTGSAATLISNNTFRKFFSERKLEVNKAQLRTYTGENVKVLGTTTVHVQYHNHSYNLPLLVVEGQGPSLLGRDWLGQLQVSLMNINQVTESPNTVQELENKHPDLWKPDLGRIIGLKAKINVPENATPKFFKPRQVPYAIKDKVDEELQRLEKEGVIEPVQFAEWAAPVVPVQKANGQIRLCGDYRLTINCDIHTDQYPLPRIEDLYARLSGGQKFTKLDLSSAFLQVPLEEVSRKYTTINTHRGLYQYTRLPFGISSSPSIFQRIVDNLIQGLKGTVGYQDDILVTGKDDAEHVANLNVVLQKLSGAGLRLNKDKCVFMAAEVVYLGYRIDAKGLHPIKEKVRAIVDAPAPTNVTELRSYLGLLNYYGRFLPNLSSVLAPLHELLQKNTIFKWGKPQQDSFEKSKQLLNTSGFLVHFDATKEIILSCDASQKGIGAVISHIIDGVERPISCASRSLTAAEKGYSQLEKEALAVVWGVKKFHTYLYGRHFVINNDHRPLETLFGGRKLMSTMASGRILRWSLTLSAYDYEFKYKPGTQIAHADALSRLPLPDAPTTVPLPADTVHLLNFLSSAPITPKLIAEQSTHDPVLSKVLRYLAMGWPDTVEDDLRPYFSRRNELSLEQGCILWGTRVVVPMELRSLVLQMLHEGHIGIVKTKSFARRYVYWPGIDQDIEQTVRTCSNCQSTRPSPGPAPLHPWEFPNRPWSRVHIDYAGPLPGNKMVLVIADAHSKWIDAHVTGTATSAATIEKLRISFSTHGLPDTVVSDNGTCFTSKEFKAFMEQNGVRHITVAPYHPSSNGFAEKAVNIVKDGLKHSEGALETKLMRVLFKYRTTPHTTTGETPSKLLMGRELKTPLDSLRPSLRSKVETRQQEQKLQHDKTAIQRSFSIGDLVYARNFGRGEAWLPGLLVAQTGPVSFIVELLQGGLVRKHQDQVRKRFAKQSVPSETPSVPQLQETLPVSIPPLSATGEVPSMPSTEVICSPATANPTNTPKGTTTCISDNVPILEHGSPVCPSPVLVRRSQRAPKPRILLDL